MIIPSLRNFPLDRAAISDELIRLEVVDYITDSTIREAIKNEIKPWGVNVWCISQSDAEFVTSKMVVLGVYQCPYDPLRLVVCIDERNRLLIKGTLFPYEPGQLEEVDSMYVCNGVANILMISEMLEGKRETVVTQTRTTQDFADILRHTSDNLYKSFRPEEARRLAESFEWHYTLKHGSWLDMDEIEIGIMSGQVLSKPLLDFEIIKEQIRIWIIKRNEEHIKID